jgi:hypothetical protein
MPAWRLIIGILFVMIALSISPEPLAQTIERLVMPGPVVEGHAEIEDECAACHKPFQKASQNALCRDCHEDIDADIRESTGFHGLSSEVAAGKCATCHTDHVGRDADIVELDESSFNHDLTDFHLMGAHRLLECTSCHTPGKRHRDAPATCIDCHAEDDVHEGRLGTACTDCHNESDWQNVIFDHDTTGYPLIGRHREVACLDCHADRTFVGAPVACIGCHEKDDVHEGRSGRKCDSCHDPRSWGETSFDHERDTEFPLSGSHAGLACGDCHSEEPFSDALTPDCVSCHLDDDAHDGHYGPDCAGCHADTAWDDIRFDHSRDTDYPLRGAHEPLACNDCHVEPVFEVALDTGCNACHADDDPHKGEQGTECRNCHSEFAWSTDVYFDHGLTAFPLLGKHADVACEDCHETQVFRDADVACVSCHRTDDPHEGRYVEDCALCHNPVSWDEWRFDHNASTDFPLEGAHVEVACDDCHRQSLEAIRKIGSQCGDCHRADDVHNGRFGFDCERCHSADSFRNVRNIR